MTSLTIVLAPEDATSGAAREVLEGWVRSQLIRPLLWVELSAEGMQARWLTDGSDPLDLYAAIAAEPYHLVRLMSLVAMRSSDDMDPESWAMLRERCHAIQQQVQASLASNQRFRRVTLVSASQGATKFSDDTFGLHSDVNVIIAPESRVTPDHASMQVTDSAHAVQSAAGLASIGGLWWSADSGAFDDDEPLQGPEPTARVVRVFARSLQIEGVLSGIAKETLARRRSSAWAASAVGGAAAPDPVNTIENARSQYLRRYGDRLSFTPPRPPTGPRIQDVSILRAFAEMFRFILRGLRDLPRRKTMEVRHAVMRRVESFAQNVTYGEGSTVAVIFGGRRGVRHLEMQEQDAAEATGDFAAELLRQVTGESATPPAIGNAWAALRQTAFSLHDGSNPPDGVDPPMDGVNRSIITEPELVVPDPMEGPLRLTEVPDGFDSLLHTPIRPCDAYQAYLVRELLDAGGHLPQPEPENFAISAEEADQAQQSSAEEPSEADRETLDRLKLQLQVWVEQRERSLLWQVADHVGRSLAAAQEALIESLRQAAAGQTTDESAMQREQKKLRRSWSWISGSVVGLSVLLYFLYPPLGITVGVPLIVGHVVGTLLIWLGALLWRFLRYQRAMFRLKHSQDLRHLRYTHALKTAPELAHQVVALASAYEQLREWAEVIGWLSHHPEGPSPLRPPAPEEHDPPATPPNVRVTRGVTEETSRRRVGAIVGREIFGTGWLNELYGRYERASMDRLRFEEGLETTPDPDWDLTRPRPLSHLLGDISSGRSAENWGREVLDRVADALGRSDPDDVRVDIGGDQELSAKEFLSDIVVRPQEAEEICPPMWGEQARLSRAGLLTRFQTWLPVALQDTASAAGLSLRPTRVMRPRDDVFAYEAIRVDSTDPVHADATVLFRQEQGPPPDEGPEADPSAPW